MGQTVTKVSVITAAYNCSSHIERVVDSVRRQSIVDWEMLIVDDASTDNTFEVAERIAAQDQRIKVWTQQVNSGPSAARNRGINSAKGEWVTVLDADDTLRPQRLERLLEVAHETGVDVVADNLVKFDDIANQEGDTSFEFFGSRMTMMDLLDSEIARDRPSFALLKPMIRRSVLMDNDIRYREDLRFAEDLFLYSELLLSGYEFALLNEALYLYTTQMGEISNQKSTATRTHFTPETRVWIADELLRLYEDRMSEDVIERLAEFRSFSVEYTMAHRISLYRHSKQYPQMIGLMVTEPRAAVRFAKTLRPIRKLLGTSW